MEWLETSDDDSVIIFLIHFLTLSVFLIFIVQSERLLFQHKPLRFVSQIGLPLFSKNDFTKIKGLWLSCSRKPFIRLYKFLRFQNNFTPLVFLGVKVLVTGRCFAQIKAMRNNKRRVNFSFFNRGKKFWHIFLHMRLSHFEG